jgi:hypothetical protein
MKFHIAIFGVKAPCSLVGGYQNSGRKYYILLEIEAVRSSETLVTTYQSTDGGQSGAGAGFLRVLRFPLPIFIPPIAPQSPLSIIWGLYNRPEVAAVPSGLSPTPLTIKKT